MLQLCLCGLPGLVRPQTAARTRTRGCAEKKAQSFNDLYEFDPGDEQSKWTHITAAHAPPPRARHAAFALDDNNLLIFGGVDKRSRFNDLWVYNCPTKTWTEVIAEGWQHTDESGEKALITPAPRAHFTASKFFNRIFVFGGYGGAGIVHGDLWVLHIDMQSGDQPKLGCVRSAGMLASGVMPAF